MSHINSNQEIIPQNLFSPLAARTDTTIALLWDKPEDASGLWGYQIYIDGSVHGRCECTDYTITGLMWEQEYEISICAILKNGQLSLQSNTIKVRTKAKPEIFDITSFGAIGDGKALNTVAIQKAIDACTEGGRVYIPKGIFRSGAIYLKSNMTLYIEEGGLLFGSDDPSDYPVMTYRFEGLETPCYSSLINSGNINGDRLENITIAGQGKIDANGSLLLKSELSENKGKRGRAICLRNVDHVYLKDIMVKHSPAWCVHLIYCNDVAANQIQIYTRRDEYGNYYEHIHNGDGLNPDSSSNVNIFHSMIASQDDCIAIKSGRNEEGRSVGIPSENIRITNCTFRSGFGVAVGSEMSGGVRNVLVQDCIFENVYSVGSVKAPRGRGGIIENITYKDITLYNYDLEFQDCKWFRGAIYIDQFYSHDEFDYDQLEEVDAGTSIIRNITFENIKLDTQTGNAIYLAGLPESPLKNIYLKNVDAIGKYGLKAFNIKGLVMENVSVESREDDKFLINNITNFILK